MNREIKFRGKRTDNKLWVEGFYFYNERTRQHGIHCSVRMGVLMDNVFEVIPETVGQFTGLTDKNGKEIFEGDIVQFAVKKCMCKKCDNTNELGVNLFCPSCGEKLNEEDFITTSKIVFDEGSFAYEYNHTEYSYQLWKTYIAEAYIEWKQIIGNIHDNPELLK